MLKVDGMNRRPLLLAKGLYRLYGPRVVDPSRTALSGVVPTGFHPMDSGMPEKSKSGWLNTRSMKIRCWLLIRFFGDKALAQAA